MTLATTIPNEALIDAEMISLQTTPKSFQEWWKNILYRVVQPYLEMKHYLIDTLSYLKAGDSCAWFHDLTCRFQFPTFWSFCTSSETPKNGVWER
jgi:hypothetical protein